MNKTKQFAGRTLVFQKVKEYQKQFYIVCRDKETNRRFILGLNEINTPLFKSEDEAIEYWNAPQDGSDKWNNKTIWGMEDI